MTSLVTTPGRARQGPAVAGLVFGWACVAGDESSAPDTVEGHVAAAIMAADPDHVVLLGRICTQATGVAPRPAAATASEGIIVTDLAGRGPAAPHPFVVGSERIARCLTVAAECAKAGLLGVG